MNNASFAVRTACGVTMTAIMLGAGLGASVANAANEQPLTGYGFTLPSSQAGTGPNGVAWAGNVMGPKANDNAISRATSGIAGACAAGDEATAFEIPLTATSRFWVNTTGTPVYNQTWETVSGLIADGSITKSGQFGYQFAYSAGPELYADQDALDPEKLYEIDCSAAPLKLRNGDQPLPGDPYSGGGTFVPTREVVTRPVYTTRDVYAAKAVVGSVKVQLDRYAATNRAGTNWVGGKAVYTKAGPLTAAQRAALVALDDDNQLSYREDGALWTASTHKTITVTSSDVAKYGSFSAAIAGIGGWGAPVANLSVAAPRTSYLKAWVLAPKASVAAPWGADRTLAQHDYDAAGQTPVASSVKVKTGRETVQTGTEEKKILLTEEQTYLDAGWTVVPDSQF